MKAAAELDLRGKSEQTIAQALAAHARRSGASVNFTQQDWRPVPTKDEKES